MRLLKYLALYFFISTTFCADLLKMESGKQFCSSAAPTVYLEYTGGKTQNSDGAWGYEREFKIFRLPQTSNQKPVGYIKVCFSSGERLVMLDRLEIYKEFQRQGLGTAATIVGFKTFLSRLGDAFDAYRVMVSKDNVAANTLYTAMGFKSLSDEMLTKYLGELKDFVTKTENILDLPRADFLARFPKPVKPAITAPPTSPDDDQSN